MSTGFRSLTTLAAMIVEERNGGRRGLVNPAQILHAWIVGRHLLDQQIGITEDDRKEILELVLELVLVAHRITCLSRRWCEPSAIGIRCASASMVDALSKPDERVALRRAMGRLSKHGDKLVNEMLVSPTPPGLVRELLERLRRRQRNLVR